MNQGKYVFSQITEFISQRCWDLDRLYRIGLLNSFFVIREKRRPKFEVPEGEDLLEGPDNILKDSAFLYKNRWAVDSRAFATGSCSLVVASHFSWSSSRM